ncbi:mechanosensitive ion channel [Aquisediminimonas sediminicola]|uniref:mechanosensitive ion channel n=1 Tax=Alteraquisediminimonas sediminicola TaxID=2676787 RepID=UPI001C8CFF6E|nr:mechanosensitive ion channel [Aquisediminimonas sediminicola]
MDLTNSTSLIDWVEAQRMAVVGLSVLGILIVTWGGATACKWGFAKLVDGIPLLRRTSGSGESVGLSLGKIVSLLIWLLGLIAVLQQLCLNRVIAPLQTLVDQTFAFVPQIVGAVVIFFIGTVVARIVGQITETTLATADLDGWAAKAGLQQITGDDGRRTGGITKTIGTLLCAVVMILFSIAALQTLGISSITEPAVNVLTTVSNAIPRLIAAAVLLAIAYFIGRWVSNLTTTILPSLGFDQALQSLNVVPSTTTPSAVVGKLALTAIMIFAAIEATQMLEFDELTIILVQITDLGGRVLFGSAIIAVGAVLANIVAGLVANSSGHDSMAVAVLRYAIIALAVAMGLRFMGLANEIVNLAFGLILGSVSIACALAFGIGGREAAAKVLAKWLEDHK